MSGTNRALRTVALVVAPARRARFVEEWRADLEAARAVGLSSREIVVAAARVALLLLAMHVRASAIRRRGRAELLGTGAVLGLVLVVADVPMDVLAPGTLPMVVWWVWTAVRTWIDAAE